MNTSEIQQFEVYGEEIEINISLISPSDFINSSDRNISFVYNYTGDNADTCSLLIDGLENLSIGDDVVIHFLDFFNIAVSNFPSNEDYEIGFLLHHYSFSSDITN
jgi:hypothetical protein